MENMCEIKGSVTERERERKEVRKEVLKGGERWREGERKAGR